VKVKLRRESEYFFPEEKLSSGRIEVLQLLRKELNRLSHPQVSKNSGGRAVFYISSRKHLGKFPKGGDF